MDVGRPTLNWNGVRKNAFAAQVALLYYVVLLQGLTTTVRGRWREGLKQLFAPIGYWRLWPNAVVLAAQRAQGARTVLDVSSPKALSLVLARDSEVRATDLDDPALMTRWKPTAEALGLASYRVQFEDACALDFPDRSFDLVYSISVIEHIPKTGDTRALEEFARVVKPGGLVVVEVPFRRQYEEISLPYDSKGAPLESPRFYERHYDLKALNERLIVPGLSLKAQWILGEWLPIDPWIATPRLPRPIRLAILPFEPLLAVLNYWMRSDDSKGRPLAAIRVFQREAA
jgi:SAM-dependent methyltransferase